MKQTQINRVTRNRRHGVATTLSDTHRALRRWFVRSQLGAVDNYVPR